MTVDELATVKQHRFDAAQLAQWLNPVVAAFAVQLPASALKDTDMACKMSCSRTVTELKASGGLREPACGLIVKESENTID